MTPRMVRLAPTLLVALAIVGFRANANQVSTEEYQRRRDAYANRTGDGVTVIFSGPENELSEFEVEKNFYYLTGSMQPDSALVIAPLQQEHANTLFIPERDLAQERWTGIKPSPGAETARILGIERVLSLNDFQSELQRLAAGQRKIYVLLPTHKKDRPPSIQDFYISQLRQLFPFSEFLDAAGPTAFLRMKKSESELSLIKQAISITMEAHKAAAGELGRGRYEFEMEASVEYQFRKHGAARPAFPSIIASGPNSVILHYDKNVRQMEDGELVVVDIGAEFQEYAADITRTYPVAGKFSPRQREIYSIVLAAQDAALAEVKPGVTIEKSGPIHRAAFDYINSHGKDSKGAPLGQYFIHGTSHHLGLDVHDAVSEPSRPLEPGMVITVEPGIYLPDENLGVRIEDDVLVTDSGYELLTKDLPRRPDEIEAFIALMKRNHKDARMSAAH